MMFLRQQLDVLPRVDGTAHFPPQHEMGTAQDMELHVSALRKDWYYLHRVNLVSIMYELLQRRNFKMLSRVTTALLNTYSHLKAVFCDEGGSKTKWAVLQQVLRYGLETMLKASNTLEDEKVQKYMAALRNMKGIFAFRDREAFDLDLGFFHLRRRNVMMAYETLNAMSKRRLAGVAGRKSSKLLYQRSLSCGLIRHTQWLEAIKRDAERISASGHPLDFAAELWGFDFFLWQRAGRDMIDFWTEAVKHLKEALSHRPGCTVAASVLVHLELAGGHRADALAVARGLAEAVPHSPDALALLCLLARSRPPGRADSGRGLPAGDDERPGPRASEDGAEDLRGETAHDEGARVAELCRLHLELLRQMPESHEAFEGLWSLRESLSPSALLEGVLEHMDALGGGCAIPPSRWQQLLQALESPSVTALADSQDSEGLGELQRIDDMLQERRGWWGRCVGEVPLLESALLGLRL
uniref:Uncharacterized protein n=1 Tax=Tetraselmis sp. GSL018 TaxID=582737 RepID=A0A061SJB8_9CHLO